MIDRFLIIKCWDIYIIYEGANIDVDVLILSSRPMPKDRGLALLQLTISEGIEHWVFCKHSTNACWMDKFVWKGVRRKVYKDTLPELF